MAREGEDAMEWLGKEKRDSAAHALLKLFVLSLALGVVPTWTPVAQNNPGIIIPRQSIAQVPAPLSLEVFPTCDLPLGDNVQWFMYGRSVDLGVSNRAPKSIFSLLGGVGHFSAPIHAATSLSLAVARVGGGARIPLTGGTAVLMYGASGYSFAAHDDFWKNASEPYLAGGVGLRFSLGPRMGVIMEACVPPPDLSWFASWP
jgi:hypothetical protein